MRKIILNYGIRNIFRTTYNPNFTSNLIKDITSNSDYLLVRNNKIIFSYENKLDHSSGWEYLYVKIRKNIVS
jgi:hypothetical protein